jgi:uncharacterized protein (DUF885 family)
VPNAAQYREFANRLDGIASKLTAEASKAAAGLPAGVVSGGRLQTTIERTLDASASHVHSATAVSLTMAAECRARSAHCASYEAALLQYQAQATAHSAATNSFNAQQKAYDNAVAKAKPGEILTATPPGSPPGNPPTPPAAPPYWSN